MFDVKKFAKSERKGFSIIPEGEIVLKIVSAEYKKALCHMVITLVDKTGVKHVETFRFVKNGGEINQVAVDRFHWLAENAMQNPNLSIEGWDDEQDLVSKYVTVTVTHKREPSKTDPSKIYTNVYINNFKPSDGWNEDDVDPLEDL